MMLVMTKLLFFFIALPLVAVVSVKGQSNAATAEGALKSNFEYINQKVLAMALDFPADKYDFRLKPEMRSFGAVIVHIAAGNVYAAKAGRGAKVQWTELDSSKYPTKAECIAMFKKSVEGANAALAISPKGPTGNLEPFLSVIQHSSEHYGLLVAYYRANGLVPPESKDKK